MLTYEITGKDHCRRLDSFLLNLMPDAPVSYLNKLVKSGHVKVNGAAASPDTMLRLADGVAIKESGKTMAMLTTREPALDLLYEDSWIVAFNKTPGLPVHRAAEVGSRNLVELGTKFLAGHGRPGALKPVNRLDSGTSGAVIMARSSVAAGMFGTMIMNDGLDKVYLALVSPLLPREGVITTPLDGKDCVTRYRLLHDSKEGALAAVYPVTGRTHQIRRHFREIAHPIWGDIRYGGKVIPGLSGHALHSFRTALSHPASAERLTIHAPLPDGFLELLAQISGDEYAELLKRLPDLI